MLLTPFDVSIVILSSFLDKFEFPFLSFLLALQNYLPQNYETLNAKMGCSFSARLYTFKFRNFSNENYYRDYYRFVQILAIH